MKRLFIICSFIISSVLSMNAQDLIFTKDNKTITSVVKEIGDDYILYKAFDNQAGPDYRLALSKVERIKYSNGKEESFNTSLSGTFSGGVMKKKGDYLRLDGRKLFDDEVEAIIGSTVYKETYVGARKQIKLANTLLLTGAGLFATGLSGIAIWAYDYGGDGLYVASYLTMLLGGVCIDACIPISIIGSSRMKWVAEDYNRRSSGNQASINFGVQQNGVGLALRF